MLIYLFFKISFLTRLSIHPITCFIHPARFFPAFPGASWITAATNTSRFIHSLGPSASSILSSSSSSFFGHYLPISLQAWLILSIPLIHYHPFHFCSPFSSQWTDADEWPAIPSSNMCVVVALPTESINLLAVNSFLLALFPCHYFFIIFFWHFSVILGPTKWSNGTGAWSNKSDGNT